MSGYTPGSAPASRCPHVTVMGNMGKEDIIKIRELPPTCSSCGTPGPNLWLCLFESCLQVGCGESSLDHSSKHLERNKGHMLTLNLTSLRVWCYSCQTEVFLENNDPPLLNSPIIEAFEEEDFEKTPESKPSPTNGGDYPFRVSGPLPGGRGSIPNLSPTHSLKTVGGSSGAFDESDDEDEDQAQPRGLTGLQNLGNTCYMNSALQTLSNCPPLTQFFLDCEAFTHTDLKPMLSKSYKKLLDDIWHRKRPSYVTPSGVAHGIKMVHPMFKGYTQQDTQEFLRCFMDQIHEELKIPVEEPQEEQDNANNAASHQTTPVDDTSSSQSEIDYETCDSGLSSQKSKGGESLSSPEYDGADALPADEKKEAKPRMVNGYGEGQGDDVAGLRRRVTSTSNSDGSEPMKNEYAETNGVADDELLEEGGSDKTFKASPMTNGVQGGTAHYVPVAAGSRRRQTSVGAASSGSGKRLSESDKANSKSSHSSRTKAPSEPPKVLRYRSIISDVFDGRILSSVQCLTCDRVSTTKEAFQDLSLPIPSRDHLSALQGSQSVVASMSSSSISSAAAHALAAKASCSDVYTSQGWIPWMFSWFKSWFWGPVITLHNCLQAFFSADELKGDNMYSCERCKKLRNGIKFSRVMDLPEVLCIHLKRFRHEFMFSTKISSYVKFPLEGLDMQPYIHRESAESNTVYDLIGVICHHGTAGGGHYTAYALNPISAQWYEYDDMYVTEVDSQQVENCEPYVLFYRKQQNKMPTVRAKAIELMQQKEKSLMQFIVSKQWINKFNTFADPGPISNDDFICPHGGVPPHLLSRAEDMVITLSQPVWQYLHGLFGGGPAVNRLYACSICQSVADKLVARQKYELDAFIKLNQMFQAEENPCIIYAISMSWFKEWETFVRNREKEPPGPIENSCIAQNRVGLVYSVKVGSDYGQLSKEMFQFLHEIYGGGPIVLVHSTEASLEAISSSPHANNGQVD